jgi:hypothetical protein
LALPEGAPKYLEYYERTVWVALQLVSTAELSTIAIKRACCCVPIENLPVVEIVIAIITL